MTTASHLAFKRVSPMLRAVYVAESATVHIEATGRSHDVAILMGRLVVTMRDDGTLGQIRIGHGQHSLSSLPMPESWGIRNPIMTRDEIVEHVGDEADMVSGRMLTNAEREAIEIEEEYKQCDGTFTSPFRKRIMRRLLGYHHDAEQAASLCTLAMARLIDPDLAKAVRKACGWRANRADILMRAWNRTQADGRETGMSSRPIQVACIAMLMRDRIEDVPSADGSEPGCGEGVAEAFSETASNDPLTAWGRQAAPDLNKVADELPAALRRNGVNPAFWRMALRMTTSQLHAMSAIARCRIQEAAPIMNALALVGETKLPPTLLRAVCETWEGSDELIKEATLAILHRACIGIADRPRRIGLRIATAKLREVLDHLADKARDGVMEAVEAALPERDATISPDQFHPDIEKAVMLRTRLWEKLSLEALPNHVPSSLPWKRMVEASDVWHAAAILAMDEGDSRSWAPLLPEPIVIGDVVATELSSAAALRQETRDLAHCVGTGGYADSCMNGRTRIVSLRVPGRRTRSTMELRLIADRWTCPQHRGPSNSAPKKELVAAARKVLSQANAAMRRTDAPRVPAPESKAAWDCHIEHAMEQLLAA